LEQLCQGHRGRHGRSRRGARPDGAVAQPARDLRAIPFVFIGNDGDCGPGTFGSHIRHFGMARRHGPAGQGRGHRAHGVPDTRTTRTRLLLSKNGPTTDCSSAGARIVGAQGMTVDATSALGFDYRNGGHCGAGAPRFNLTVKPPTGPNTFHFIGGCANGAQSPAPRTPRSGCVTGSC